MRQRGILTTILFLAIAVSLLTLIFKEEPLPEYHETPVEVDEKTPIYETAEFKTNAYSLQIPVNWTMVDQGSTMSFVDPATASTIEISSMVYTPVINNFDTETIRYNLESGGYKLYSYERLTNCCYRAEYTNENIAFVEWVYWDLGTIYTLTCKYSPEYYDPIYELSNHCLGSFSWNGNKIPNGYHMQYIEYGNYALLLKDGWGISVKDNAVMISDPNNGFNATVYVEKTDGDYSGISQLDYTNKIAINKTNFLQSSFVNTGTEMSATATYTENGALIDFYEYCLVMNGYSYDITIRYLDENASLLTADHRLFTDYLIIY